MESTKEFAVRYLNSIRGDLNPEDHVASFIAVRAAAPDTFVDKINRLRKWQEEALPYLNIALARLKPRPLDFIRFNDAIDDINRLIAEAQEDKE